MGHDAGQSATRKLREPQPDGAQALSALVAAIDRRLQAVHLPVPPEAFILAQRPRLLQALESGLLDFVDAVDWRTFRQVSPAFAPAGIDGLYVAVGLSLPAAIASGMTAAVVDSLGTRHLAWPASLLFKRLTRCSAGHIVFRSQFLELAECEFRTTPLELSRLLVCHTPAAIRAMLLGRAIAGRPDLDSRARRLLVVHATQHLGRLLPEAQARSTARALLRLAFYRLEYPIVARHVLRRVRIVDFRSRREVSNA